MTKDHKKRGVKHGGESTNDLNQRSIERKEKRQATIFLNRFHNYLVTSAYQGCNHVRQVIFSSFFREYKYKHPPQVLCKYSHNSVCAQQTQTFLVQLKGHFTKVLTANMHQQIMFSHTSSIVYKSSVQP